MSFLSEQNINLLRKNARSVVRELGLLNDAYFEVGVTLAERHLLIELFSAEQLLTAKEIAERLLLDKSTVSRLITRAVKKGWIISSADQNDKRKQLLELTDSGKSTLFAFEPIAFNQTKSALETLSLEERDLVYRGVALYAQGLKNSRLQQRSPSSLPATQIESLEEVHQQLHQLGYRLERYKSDDEAELFAIFKEVVDAGCQFPYGSSSKEEFLIQFLSARSQVYVCRSFQGHVVGGFYLKPNYSGKSQHIANAAYMLEHTRRGKGIGTLLIQASLQIAKKLGFLAMQFNLVFSRNTRAIKLYEKLGFQMIGTIPHAILNLDGSFQDGHILYRRIDNL